MCYSGQVLQHLKRLQRKFNAQVDYAQVEELFLRRLEDDSIRIGKAFEANFVEPASPAEQRIHDAIETYRTRLAQKWETTLFAQKKRLADAERQLLTKSTKKALEDRRIATDKIEALVERLGQLRRRELKPGDSRIFPMWYAPVVVWNAGSSWVRLMRYHCRPAGKPAFYDRKYPGLYNARRDNLSRFWRGEFAHSHAVVVMTGFYENVALNDFEHRPLRDGEAPQNLVLHFNPQPEQEMTVACLWSHWEGKGEPSLDSFAAITDEPPPEIAATGHNRCVVVLEDSHVESWLRPDTLDVPAIEHLLDDRPVRHFEHRRAA